MSEWPKLLSVSKFASRWYVDVSTETIKNRIKAKKLPGKREGGKWFVWVNEDLRPAFNYNAPADQNEPKLSGAANDAIQRILGNAS